MKGTRLGWLLVLPALTAGCASAPLRVHQPPTAPVVPSSLFRAGAAEADITPPPGLPVFGASLEAEARVTGYRMRLFARALILEDAAGSRLALVQVDLGAVSGLLHREVAKRTAVLGLSPDRLLLAATHTHGAPGGYFGAAFHNKFGSARCGFDPEVLEWFVTRITRALQHAATALAPARLGASSIMVPGVTRNRSRDAWRRNFGLGPLPPDITDTTPVMHVLRVDHAHAAGSTPIAGVVVFGVHSTAASGTQPVYHGDLHTTAAVHLRHLVLRAYPTATSFAPVLLNGAEGDVSPDWSVQNFRTADVFGTHIAAKAFAALQQATPAAAPLLEHAYQEIVVPNAPTVDGPLCDRAVVGVPVLGGAEDVRSQFAGKFGIREGTTRKPRGCHTVKRTALGLLQKLLTKPSDFPQVAPFQVIRLGTILTLATVPGEPTTETGRRITDTLKGTTSSPVAVVGLANEYMGYFTTPAEYAAQHYEGGSTLYGPPQGAFALQQLDQLATSLDSTPIIDFPLERSFYPGRPRSLWGERGPCQSNSWQPGAVHQTGTTVTFRWRGLAAKENCPSVPRVSIECDGRPLRLPNGSIEDDGAPTFHVARSGPRNWTARWTVSPGLPPATACRFRVERPSGAPLFSGPFLPHDETRGTR